jgi:hypothetical protein
MAPVGWTLDSQGFFYLRGEPEHPPSLWKTDISSGTTQFQRTLPSNLVSGVSLSPEATHLLFSVLEQHEPPLSALMVAPIQKEGEERIIFRGAKEDKPINQYAAIWSLNNQAIFVHAPPENERSSSLERVRIETGQKDIIPTVQIGSDEFFIPRSLSPDGNWLIVLKYPLPQSLVYLVKITDGQVVPLPLTQPSNWLAIFGWAN